MPKKRSTAAKTSLNSTITIEELLSPSENEEEEEDEWRPEKPERGRRASKKPKTTGVRLGLQEVFMLVICVVNLF